MAGGGVGILVESLWHQFSDSSQEYDQPEVSSSRSSERYVDGP